MFGFPVNLQDGGVQKFTNDADSGFPKIQQREVFYSVMDGNWSDLNTWQTASGRVGKLPSQFDDVYIRHTVGGSFSASINKLIITPLGVLNGSATGSPLVILNSLQSYGTFNYAPNSTGSGNNQIVLCGVNNYIDKTKQTPTCILYGGSTAQPIIDANYTVLRWGNYTSIIPLIGVGAAAGEKYLTCDLVVGGLDLTNLGTVQPIWINFKNFNFTNNGNISAGGTHSANFYCDGNGTLIFKGSANFPGGFYCSESPTIEFQNGATIGPGANVANWTLPYHPANCYLGNGFIRFTTNNQILLTAFATQTLDNIIEIDSNIILTLNVSNVGTSLNLTKTINGINAASKLLQGTNSILNFLTLASVSSMTTGIFDFTTNANTIGYTGNYSATIPSYFNTFHNLTISGTGIKSLGVNTTINSNLTLTNNTSATLQCSSYNLVVLGNTNIASNLLAKNSNIGTITFNGLVSMGNGEGFNFSGNPNVEFKNGLNCTNVGGTNTNTGTGIWKFSTNNQLFTTAGACFTNINSSILIDGITLTMNQTYGNFTLYINNIIDGTNSSSNLILNAPSFIYLTLAFNNISNATLMPTFGTADVSTGSIQYNFNNNFTLPYTTYGKLVIGGTGIKTLSGNTTIGSGGLSYIQNTSGYLECSTFNLTINGNTNVPSLSTLSKNGVGNITFVGQLSGSTSSPSVQPSTINFIGNPNVEFRNGMIIVNSGAEFTTGTGTFTFTTNNQNIDTNIPPVFNCNIIVNNIVLSHTCTQGNFSTMTINGTLNGFNSASTFRMGTGNGTPSINYRNATQPMATGILDTSTNLNTWIYGLGNQDIKGSPTISPKQVYRNLTLNGTGVKTLQGYVSVLNTYTLTSPATLNNNGFSLTNP